MLRIKICGITNVEDALLSVEAGADAIGLIFAKSERRVTPETAKEIIEKIPPWIASVGVFVNETNEEILRLKNFCRFTWVQLHGNEPDSVAEKLSPWVIKTIFSPEEAVEQYPCRAYLLDQKKGVNLSPEERLFRTAEQIKTSKPLILGGGLTPDNVAKARSLPLFGVDVARGVEAYPGKKDPDKLKRFIEKAKGVGDCPQRDNKGLGDCPQQES